MAYQMQWEDEGLRIRYSRTLTYEDLRDAAAQMVADPRYSDIRYAIGDYAEVVEVQLNQRQIEQVAALHWASTLSNPRLVAAIVVNGPEMASAFAAYLGVGLVKSPMAMFSDLGEAREWLRSTLRPSTRA